VETRLQARPLSRHVSPAPCPTPLIRNGGLEAPPVAAGHAAPSGELKAEARTARLLPVPVAKVRFLQAMAEDGPGAQHRRIGGDPVQQVVQRTTC